MNDNLITEERASSEPTAVPMTAKEFLQQYRNADEEINVKLDQIYKLRTLAAKTTNAFTPDRVQASGPASKLENIVARIVDMENEVDADIDRLLEKKRQVEAAIAAVPDSRQRDVLSRRYINGQGWERIAYELNYTYRHTTRMHGEALLAVERNMSLNVLVNPC